MPAGGPASAGVEAPTGRRILQACTHIGGGTSGSENLMGDNIHAYFYLVNLGVFYGLRLSYRLYLIKVAMSLVNSRRELE